MTWKVIITKDDNNMINVNFEGEINTYEIMSVLDMEREKLKQTALSGIK